MDTSSQTEAGSADLLTDAAVAQMIRHRGFRAAAEAHAAQSLASYRDDDDAGRWMVKDLGRSALCGGVIILDAMPKGLTASGLAAFAQATGVASRGRTFAFLQYALACERIIVAPGPEPWIHRRLVLTPAFVGPHRRRLKGRFEAAALVA